MLDQVASAVECWALQFRYPLPKLGWSGTVTIGVAVALAGGGGLCSTRRHRRWLLGASISVPPLPKRGWSGTVTTGVAVALAGGGCLR